MTRKHLKYSFLLLLSICSFVPTYAQSKKTYLGNAKSAFDGKHYDEAIANYLRVLEIEPENTTAIWYTAQAYYNINCYAEALRYYKKSTKVSQYENAFINLGGFSAQMGYDEIARYALDKALEYNPQSATAYASKGGNDIQYGRFESARENLNKAIEADSTNAGAYMNMSIVCILEDDEDGRLKYLTKYMELMPNDAVAYSAMGQLKKREKDKNYKADLWKGIEACNMVLQKNRFDKIIARRAKLYNTLGKYELAKRDYLQALEIYNEAVTDLPDSWFMRFHRAEIYIGLKEYDKAQVDFEAVLEMNPAHPTVPKDLDKLKELKEKGVKN